MADQRAHAHPQTGEPVDDGFGDDPLAELTRIVAERTAPQPAWTPPRPGGAFGRATPQAVTATRAPASARLPAMEVYVPPPEPEPLPPPPAPVMSRPEPVPPPAVAPEPVPPPVAPRPQVRPLFPTAAQAALDARAAGAATVAQQSYAFFAEQRSRAAAPRSLGDPEETRPGGQGASPAEMDDPLAELARLASDPSLFERSFRRAGTQPPARPVAGYDPVAEEEAGYYDDGYAPQPAAAPSHAPARGPVAGRGYHDDDAEDLARNEAPVGTSTVDAYVPGDLESHAVPEVEDVRPLRAAPRVAPDLYADDHWDEDPEPARQPAGAPGHASDPYYDDAPVWRDPSDDAAMDGAAGLTAGAPADMPMIPGEEQPRRQFFGSMRGVLIVVGILAVSLTGLVGYRMIGGGMSDGPPRVFEDDGLPAKGPPERASPEGDDEAAPGKTIYDRVDGTTDASNARLVERPAAPVDSLPGVGGGALPATGETVMEPRRVRTVVVRPDGTIMPGQTADPTAVPETAADTLPEAVPAADRDAMAGLAAADGAPADLASGEGIGAPAEETVASEPAMETGPVGSTQGALRLPERRPAPPPMRTTTTASAPPAAAAPAPATSGGPMSLIPGAPGRTTTAAAPAATQPVTAPAGGYGVQVTSQRSRDQALAAYQQLQRKFPSVLGGRAPSVQSVEISGKGTYYRVRVPAGSQAQAAQLCSQLKAAGGDCVVTRN